MSLKYTFIKASAGLIHSQRIMAQPYEKLQKTFKTTGAVPKIPRLSDEKMSFSVFRIGEHPVLYVKHKKAADSVCVYVTGGGMLYYPKPSQAKEMVKLAEQTGRDMMLPYYPLTPKYTLCNVYDMLYRLYKKLLGAYSAERTAFLGVSSGGNCTLGLISHINTKKEGLPMPGKLYVSSPGNTLLTEAEKRRAAELEKKDFIMSRKALETIFNGMTAGKDVPEYMRYLQKGDYTGLKEAYLCFGGNEIFSAGAKSIKARMEECGADVTLEIGEGMYHCYSAIPLVPECRQGYNNMIRYLRV